MTEPRDFTDFLATIPDGWGHTVHKLPDGRMVTLAVMPAPTTQELDESIARLRKGLAMLEARRG